MTEKLLSKNSLHNLRQSNRESRYLSKESLEIALLALLERKSLPQITISELVLKAGVSRNAFYRNYHSKEAIIEGRLNTILRRIFHGLKHFDLSTEPRQAWVYLLTEAKKEEQLLRIIFNHQLHVLLTKRVIKRLRAYHKWKKQRTNHYSHLFWSHAIISVLSSWIKDGMTVSIEDMAAMDLPLLSH